MMFYEKPYKVHDVFKKNNIKSMTFYEKPYTVYDV